MMRRVFLLLQGPATPFFSHLAIRLRSEGHHVLKLNFNGGDWLYGSRAFNLNYRGTVFELRDFLDDLYRRFQITDQVLFGDRRPVHRPAVEHAKTLGVRTHVYEEGYFRPHWVTLERQGVNGHSQLPRDADWFRSVGGCLPDPPEPAVVRCPFHIRATHDVLYHLAGLANPVMFRHYRTHAPVPAPVEYAGYAIRLPMMRFQHERRDAGRIRALLDAKNPFYVLPLQLDSDAQIRDHSRFADMCETIEYVMKSFASHMAGDACLVIKNHPLSPGLVDYERVVFRAATRFGVTGRVLYLESGDLELLLRHARGCVTVNSTAGIVALKSGCPTIALSDPVYKLKGLTFYGGLDEFWRNGEPPDAELFRLFRRIVIRTTQVEGDFYGKAGIAMAVENSLQDLNSDRSALEALL